MAGQNQRLNVVPTVTVLGVIKPRLGATRGHALLKKNTITYIKGELDVLEREDFFRLKKIQAYKKREIERQLAASRQFAEEQFAEIFSLQKGISDTTAHNLFSAAMQKNNDIIF